MKRLDVILMLACIFVFFSSCNVKKKTTKRFKDVIQIEAADKSKGLEVSRADSMIYKWLNEHAERNIHRQIVLFDTDKPLDESGTRPIKAIITEDESDVVDNLSIDTTKVSREEETSFSNDKEMSVKDDIEYEEKEEIKKKASGATQAISFWLFLLIVLLFVKASKIAKLN